LLGGIGLALPILINQGTLQPFLDYHLLPPTHINFLTGILIYKNQDHLFKFKSAGPLLASAIVFFLWENMLGWPNASWNTLITTLGTSICSALLIMAFLNSEKLNANNKDSFWHSRFTKFRSPLATHHSRSIWFTGSFSWNSGVTNGRSSSSYRTTGLKVIE